jgi:hypothetical protein
MESLMADRRRIEERIRRKEAEIQSLEAQIKDAKVYIQALQDVLRMFPRQVGSQMEPASVLRPSSLVAQARNILLREGAPLHVDEILRRLGKPLDRPNKTALSGSLAAYVRKGQIFTRAAPNTFGLTEFQIDEPSDEIPGDELPPDFGSDSPDENLVDEVPF